MKRAIRVLVAALALLLAGGAIAEAAPAQPLAVRHFANVRFQKCLDADTNGGGNGTRVQLWDCGPWNQQDWDVRPDGSLYNERFQKCLDADTNGGGNGTAVQLWDCGPWNQQWWVLRSDGSIYNQRFQKCLDADTNGGGNGTRIQLWDCGPWNQQWWQ